ncbi:MAG: alpha/beta hydrolase [Myxococcota bacterium]|jgi:pimeloyl-ACP methyl ester carboxylesterase|nr:alpha/beta hydrolase [Myxococcota bacterium]
MSEEIAFKSPDGLTLRAEAWGNVNDEPVLLLHGGGQTRHAWAATAATLADEGWRAISLDLRGHGESDWCPRGDYGHPAFAADVTAVAEALPSPPVLVGASLGGMSSLFALGYAQAEGRPTPGSALVLVDIATRMEMGGAQRIMNFMKQKPDGFKDLEEVADAIATYNPHRKKPSNLEGLKKNLRLHEDGRYRWHWDPAFVEGRLGPDRSHILRDLDNAARGLSIPTLLVRGRMSDLLSQEGADEFLAQVPHAQFVDVSGAGHMVAGDQNDLFTRSVLDFLTREVRDKPSKTG